MDKKEQIKQKAHDLGFELVGIAPAHPTPDLDFFRWWLDQGFAGTMQYLTRGLEKRGDPEKILPGVKSIICCGLNYYTGSRNPLISSYALGDDYHEIIAEKLESLQAFLKQIDRSAESKVYVDTGAVLERSYAAQAGLGWIGKNSCLINNGVGSFFFIGEILTTLELEQDRPALDQCGSCTKCLDACPTHALPEPGVLDANRCIAYLTVEHKGEFSREQERMVAGHIYGCDICQEVCPYNERIPVTHEPRLQPRPELLNASLADFKGMTEEDFKGVRRESAMSRIRWKEWERNVKAAG